MHVAYLQQKPVDAEFGVTDGLAGALAHRSALVP
jgi:hypothetical protein